MQKSKILVCSVSAFGHIMPLASVVTELVKRGHNVYWYTGRYFKEFVEGTGAQYAEMHHCADLSIDKHKASELLDQRTAKSGLNKLIFDIEYFFILPGISQVEDIRDFNNQNQIDLLIADSYFLGASWFSQLTKIPWVEFGITVLGFQSKDTAPFGLGLTPGRTLIGKTRDWLLNKLFEKFLLKGVLNRINDARSKVNLPPTKKNFLNDISPYLYLVETIPEFEYPRSDLPEQVKFIGPCIPNVKEFKHPEWWDQMIASSLVIHCTQGTVATDLSNLIIPFLHACKDLDAFIIASTGGGDKKSIDDSLLTQNTVVEDFIPYSHLLPHVNIMITNGGFGGVQLALSNGIPLICAGTSEDKKEVGARVAWTGTGIYIAKDKPTETELNSAIKQILNNTQFEQNAKKMQEEMAKYNAPATAVELIEAIQMH